MYRNLEAELARQGITKTKVANELGITLGTLSLKLKGKYNVTLSEAIKIKNILDVDLPIEYLFAISDNNKSTKHKYKN
jgi:DNA-binding XRE family transcriptional regulator